MGVFGEQRAGMCDSKSILTVFVPYLTDQNRERSDFHVVGYMDSSIKGDEVKV